MNIKEYIENNEVLNSLDYLTVFTTINQLIEDGYLMRSVDYV